MANVPSDDPIALENARRRLHLSMEQAMNEIRSRAVADCILEEGGYNMYPDHSTDRAPAQKMNLAEVLKARAQEALANTNLEYQNLADEAYRKILAKLGEAADNGWFYLSVEIDYTKPPGPNNPMPDVGDMVRAILMKDGFRVPSRVDRNDRFLSVNWD